MPIATRHRPRPLVATIVLGLCLALSGCGRDSGGDGDTARQLSTTDHNAADVRFATDMIQHHAQALAMVDLTRGRSLEPEVTRLAEDIRATQGPEIETMVGWLTEWGEKVPATVRDHSHAGHDMPGMAADRPGMMSAEELTALERVSDAEFQDMWLEMMIEHHEGAIEMAEAERSEGQFQPAVELAGAVIDAQSAEIAAMERLSD